MPELPPLPGSGVTTGTSTTLPKTSADMLPQEMQADSNTYYPGAKVRLAIRFENFSKKIQDDKPPAKPLKNLSGVADKRAPLKVTSDPNAPSNAPRLLLEFDGSKKPLAGMSPQLWTNSADGFTQVINGIVPKTASWVQNGIRTADTLSLTLNYLDCPIDPRTIRSCAVAFYLGTLDPDDYASGTEGVTRGEHSSQGSHDWEGKTSAPMNLIPDEYTDIHGQKRTNLRFQGWVDKWEIDMSSGEPLIQIECRDNTQMLLDQEAPARLLISAALPIDQAIAKYLTHFPQYGGLTVEYRPKKDDVPALKVAMDKTAFAPKHLAVAPGMIGSGTSNLAVWDYLTDITGAIGHSIRMEGTNIVIQEVRTFMAGKDMRRSDDPFLPRDGRVNRRLIYGRNIMDLKSSRSFVRNSPTNIEVRSLSTKDKKVYVARFPQFRLRSSDDRVSTVETAVPGDMGADEKWLVWRVQGITDEKFLRVIARQIYESLGRQELMIKLKTRDLASFGGCNLDPDILDMKPGDTVDIYVNRTMDEISSITKMEGNLLAQSEGFLRSRGFTDEFIKAYSDGYQSNAFQVGYRVKTLGFGWDAETGVQIDIEAVNYVEVMADKHLSSELSESKETSI